MKMTDPLQQEYVSIIREIDRDPSPSVMRRLHQLVLQEYHPALHTLSVCLERGIGVVKDDKLAFDYCLAAAKRGNCEAMNNLGCNFLEGRFVEKDPVRAMSCFDGAAQRGSLSGMFNSAWMLDRGCGTEANGEEALKRYKIAYNAGSSKSANNIGVFYVSGRHVVPQIDLAREWFEKGARAGNAAARQNLSRLQDITVNRVGASLKEIRRYANIWIDTGIF